jgi:hypothetical protein
MLRDKHLASSDMRLHRPMQVLRYKHFAPFGIPHATTEDTTLGGYRVPKAAQVRHCVRTV